VLDYVAGLDTLKQEERIELLARVQGLGERIAAGQPANDEPLVELILELREALRGLKRYDLADRARKALEEMGFEIGDSPQGATWTRR
jgi:cysteinyl-tRNA synthetase